MVRQKNTSDPMGAWVYLARVRKMRYWELANNKKLVNSRVAGRVNQISIIETRYYKKNNYKVPNFRA